VRALRAPLVATATKEGVRKEPWGVVIRVTRAFEPGLEEEWRTSWVKKGLGRKDSGGKAEGRGGGGGGILAARRRAFAALVVFEREGAEEMPVRPVGGPTTLLLVVLGDMKRRRKGKSLEMFNDVDGVNVVKMVNVNIVM